MQDRPSQERNSKRKPTSHTPTQWVLGEGTLGGRGLYSPGEKMRCSRKKNLNPLFVTIQSEPDCCSSFYIHTILGTGARIYPA